MRKKKALTIEQHIENGILLYQARELLVQSIILTGGNSPRGSASSKALHKARVALDEARSHLDNEYHSLATDEEFNTFAHVYYGAAQRNSVER